MGESVSLEEGAKGRGRGGGVRGLMGESGLVRASGSWIESEVVLASVLQYRLCSRMSGGVFGT